MNFPLHEIENDFNDSNYLLLTDSLFYSFDKMMVRTYRNLYSGTDSLLKTAEDRDHTLFEIPVWTKLVLC